MNARLSPEALQEAADERGLPDAAQPAGLSIKHYGLDVRRVHSGYELICERLVAGEWVEFFRTNEMSNDYAYSESSERCMRAVQALMLGAAA